MEVKKYNPFVVIKPKTKPKFRPKAKIKLEAGGLSLEMLGVFLRQVRKNYNYNYQELLVLPRSKSVRR